METVQSLLKEYRELNKNTDNPLMSERDFVICCLKKQLERIDLGIRSFSEESKLIHNKSFKEKWSRYHEALDELKKANLL